ncbi:MAG: right-handed parallel beta-helix repeat-containing protein [Paludibacter sp.]
MRIGLLSFFPFLMTLSLFAQRGYYDAPYKRYEAETGTFTAATTLSRSFKQADLQSEASDQVCVNLFNTNSAVEWTMAEAADGLVLRYSVPDGQSGTVGVYNNGTKVSTLTLTSNWSWQYLWSDSNPNNVGVVNQNPRMRFDEVRLKLASKVPLGGKLKLIRETGNITIDFVELEPVPSPKTPPAGSVSYSGDGSTLQTFIDANPGKTIFIPAGIYNVNRKLWFGVDNTKLMGAGMWYTQINFTYYSTTGVTNEGGLYADAVNVSFSDLYLTTVRNSRSYSYKAINGVFTSGSIVENIWAEHFEAGAWIAQYYYSATPYTDGLIIRNCRFRNNYADGVNLCKGTRNTMVEHCSFRNNGDDDMAIWSADGLECQNNTFQFSTSENCWRASGCAIYGGFNNKANNLYIKDNLEVGLRVNNCFAGITFNNAGIHQFTDITIDGCSTFNDLFNLPVGAIDLVCSNKAGTQVKNVKFSKIDIVDSRNDAVYFSKIAGDGFYNIVFENININGTGLEYPNNNVNSLTNKRGYGTLFSGNPAGNATYCSYSVINRGGNAEANVNTTNIGSMNWQVPTGCVNTFENSIHQINTEIEVLGNYVTVNHLNIDENIYVFNLMGKCVFSKQTHSDSENFKINGDGIYLLTLGNGRFNQKILIRK